MDVVTFMNEGMPALLGMEYEKRENMCLNFPEVAEVATGFMSKEFSVKPYEIEVEAEDLAEECLIGALEMEVFHFFEFGYKDMKTYAAICGRDWFYLRDNNGKKELYKLEENISSYEEFPQFEKVEELIGLLPWWWKGDK